MQTEKPLACSVTVPAIMSTDRGVTVREEPSASRISTRMSEGPRLAGTIEKSKGSVIVTADLKTVPDGRRSTARPAGWLPDPGSGGVAAEPTEIGSGLV